MMLLNRCPHYMLYLDNFYFVLFVHLYMYASGITTTYCLHIQKRRRQQHTCSRGS